MNRSSHPEHTDLDEMSPKLPENWSGSGLRRPSVVAGRAFHTKASYDRFKICVLTHHPPFPSLLATITSPHPPTNR